MTFTNAYRSLATAQKGRAKGAPAYSLYINRPVGRVFAAFAHTIGLTPNQVTLVSALFTFTGIALLATVPPSVPVGVIVWLLLAIGYAWDSADGQVARLRGGGSLAGEWLDHVVDAAKLVTLPLAVAVGWFRFYEMSATTWLLVPLVFAIASTVMFFGMILNDLVRARAGVAQSMVAGGSSPLRSVMALPTDYGVQCFAFVLWGFTGIFPWVYALLLLALLGHLSLALPTWFRRIRAIG